MLGPLLSLMVLATWHECSRANNSTPIAPIGPINSDIDLVIENKNKKLINLDYVYLKLLNAGKKVTLTTYESIEDVLQEFAKKPTVNKHYDLLHNIELEIKCENILNDFCFYKDYLKTTNNI